MKMTVLGEAFEFMISYPSTGLLIKIASCVDSSKSSITIFFTEPYIFVEELYF